jgi:FMN phosphatase YigB (HAD superfamily)
MVKCQTPNRNFCAPDGKNAALFFDLDGTIVVCQPYFDEAGDAFAHFMANRGFDREEARTAAREFNQKFLHEHGFEREVFNKAMVECYRHMVKSKRRRISAEDQLHDERIVYAIGTFPFFRAPHVFPNAAPVIGRAKHSFLLFAVSAGNREAQKYKVRQAGLDPVFDEIIIT